MLVCDGFLLSVFLCFISCLGLFFINRKSYIWKIAVINLKYEQWFNPTVMCPKDAEEMANSVDPDQTASNLGLHCADPSEPRHNKTNKVSVRPAKTQISLGIGPGWSGWSESSLGAHSLCWFCHVAAHLFENLGLLQILMFKSEGFRLSIFLALFMLIELFLEVYYVFDSSCYASVI